MMKNSISQTNKVYKDKMKDLIKGMLAHFDIRIVRNSYFESLTQELHLQNVRHALNQFEIIKNDMITCKASPTAKIEEFIKRFRENYVSTDLIRIGGDADGGYLIPDIFDRIAYCLSPGVADTADFEVELSRRYGIKSFMIDGSVASAPFADNNFHFLHHDLADQFKSASALSLPHRLDKKNVSHQADIEMPAIWWKS